MVKAGGEASWQLPWARPAAAAASWQFPWDRATSTVVCSVVRRKRHNECLSAYSCVDTPRNEGFNKVALSLDPSARRGEHVHTLSAGNTHLWLAGREGGDLAGSWIRNMSMGKHTHNVLSSIRQDQPRKYTSMSFVVASLRNFSQLDSDFGVALGGL